MIIKANNVEKYLNSLPEERVEAFTKLRQAVIEGLPSGFEETIQYNMITYVVPKEIFPAGYHVNPDDALGFISLGNQKNHIALYHMGIYLDDQLEAWFRNEYPKYVKAKIDMGKSCIRFKNTKTIPYDLIRELCGKMTPQDYIDRYTKLLINK